jgi:RsmE family RNA methyltransferase
MVSLLKIRLLSKGTREEIEISLLVLTIICMTAFCCRFGLALSPTTRFHGVVRSFQSTTPLQLNRFLFDPEEVKASSQNSNSSLAPPPTLVILPKDDYRTVHAAKILSLQNGDSIRAGIVGSDTSPGKLTDEATIEWIPELPVKKAEVLSNGNPPGSLKITLNNLISTEEISMSSLLFDQNITVSLILALPRPLQLGRILPMISQLGVDQLVLTSAQKVPKDYFGSHLFRKPEVLREKLIEGLCQAGDVRLPTVHIVRSLHHFLSDDLDSLFPTDSYARVIAHPKRKDDPTEPLRMRQVSFPTTKPARIVLAVGPEGGWAEPDELDLFQNLGFQQITLGSRTLRTDCAVIGLLSLASEVCYERMNP